MRTQTENLKVLVLAYLEANCRGRENGLSKARLMAALFIAQTQERRLREALDALADEHPIGSSPEHGYYLCRDEDDYAVAVATIGGYAYPSLRRIASLQAQRLAARRRQMGLRPTVQQSLFEEVPA